MTAAPDQDSPQDERAPVQSEQNESTEQDGRTPSTTELEEPSTEKPAGEEPKAPDREEPKPSHQAVGIGVIGGPLVDPEKHADAEA